MSGSRRLLESCRSLTALAAILAAALVRLAIVAVRLPHERPRAFGLAARHLVDDGTGRFGGGVSRSGLGPGAGLVESLCHACRSSFERPLLHLAALRSGMVGSGHSIPVFSWSYAWACHIRSMEPRGETNPVFSATGGWNGA